MSNATVGQVISPFLSKFITPLPVATMFPFVVKDVKICQALLWKLMFSVWPPRSSSGLLLSLPPVTSSVEFAVR